MEQQNPVGNMLALNVLVCRLLIAQLCKIDFESTQ